MHEHTTFNTPAPVRLDLELSAGEVLVEATSTQTTEVDLEPLDADARYLVDEARVERRGEEILVQLPRERRPWRGGDVRARVVLPVGSDVRVRTSSAGVTVRGDVGRLEVGTATGEVSAMAVGGEARVRTASGTVTARRVAGAARAESAAGDVEFRVVGGPVHASTASGDVRIDEPATDVTCRTASGDVVVRAARSGRVNVSTASGDVRVGVRAGTAAWLDVSSLSGDSSSSLAAADAPGAGQATVELRVRTMSGDVEVHRAG